MLRPSNNNPELANIQKYIEDIKKKYKRKQKLEIKNKKQKNILNKNLSK